MQTSLLAATWSNSGLCEDDLTYQHHKKKLKYLLRFRVIRTNTIILLKSITGPTGYHMPLECVSLITAPTGYHMPLECVSLTTGPTGYHIPLEYVFLNTGPKGYYMPL